jgi:hypothetical protein
MDLTGYFQFVIGVLMTASFVIWLDLVRAYYGDDEKEKEE